MNGAGRCIYYDSKGRQTDVFVGEFVNGIKHGYGEYRWANGVVYKGSWDHGQIGNKGILLDKK